jgi:hypothetical protein
MITGTKTDLVFLYMILSSYDIVRYSVSRYSVAVATGNAMLINLHLFEICKS